MTKKCDQKRLKYSTKRYITTVLLFYALIDLQPWNAFSYIRVNINLLHSKETAPNCPGPSERASLFLTRYFLPLFKREYRDICFSQKAPEDSWKRSSVLGCFYLKKHQRV
jgi:hypothetical protein